MYKQAPGLPVRGAEVVQVGPAGKNPIWSDVVAACPYPNWTSTRSAVVTGTPPAASAATSRRW